MVVDWLQEANRQMASAVSYTHLLRQTAGFCRLSKGHFFIFPCMADLHEVVGQWSFGAAKFDTTGFGGHNALPLTFADVFPFGLSDIGENLQNEIGDKGAGQIPFLGACIEQGHDQDKDIGRLFLGDLSPLFQNF